VFLTVINQSYLAQSTSPEATIPTRIIYFYKTASTCAGHGTHQSMTRKI
jgi:hypothetical protein